MGFNWKFWQSPVAPLSKAVRSHLAKERGLSAQGAESLRMVVQRGQYGGRSVSYFRVFDPSAAQAAGIQLRRFGDLDAHPRLRLHDGYVDNDGTIFLNKQQRDPITAAG